jgi:hypothetical protein
MEYWIPLGSINKSWHKFIAIAGYAFNANIIVIHCPIISFNLKIIKKNTNKRVEKKEKHKSYVLTN